MNLLAPRYKRYAAWPVVIWCRLRGHSSGRFWSGTTGRCIGCGDVVYAADAIPKMQQNVNYWGDRADKFETALRSIAKNTCCEGCQEAAKVARAALTAGK